MAEQVYSRIGRFIVRKLERQRRVWHVRFRDTITGRRYCRTTRETSRRQAEARAREIVDEFEARARGEFAEPVGFAGAFAEWLDSRTTRETTARGEASVGVLFASVLGADAVVSEITPQALQAALSRLARERAPTTMRRYRRVLRAFWRYCTTRTPPYAQSDPAQTLPRPVGAARGGVALERLEAARLLIAASSGPPYLRLAIEIALHTGLRKRNVLELRWKHVASEYGFGRLWLPNTMMKSGRPFEMPVHPELQVALRMELKRMGSFDLRATVVGHRQKPLRDALGPLRTALRRAGLDESIRWHDLRHTASTWWLDAMPLAAAEKLADRRIPGAAARYEHLDFRRLKKHVDALPWIGAGAVAAGAIKTEDSHG